MKTTEKLPISVIILTNRCNQVFARSLSSAQFAQEVLLIDNQSGNDWRELALKNQFRVLKYDEKISDFSRVRNWAMKEAKFEWVLFLDSDEVLGDDTREIVASILELQLYDGVYAWRSDIFYGKILKYGEAGRQRILRFFRKDLTKFERAIHETAFVSGGVGQSDIEIEHYAHENLSDFLAQVFWYGFQIGQNYPGDKAKIIFEMLFFPPLKFVWNFGFKLGFLDGWRGLIYAMTMSLHSLVVRVSAYEKN